MLLTSTAYSRAEVIAIVAVVLIAGTCKFVGIYSIRRHQWKRGLICAALFFGVVILLINVMNGDIDLEGNRVWIVREQNGQFVKDEYRLIGSSTVTLSTAKTIEVKALPNTYTEGGVTHHHSSPPGHVINDSNRAFAARWKFYNGDGKPTVVAPGALYTLEGEGGGGELVISAESNDANQGKSVDP